MGRGPHHDHTILYRSELVPTDYAFKTELLRHFQPIQWLLWNATTGVVMPKVIENTQLTARMFTLPLVLRMAPEKKLPGKSLTPWKSEPSRTISRYVNSDAFSAIRWCYQSLKFMQKTWWTILTSSRYFMIMPIQHACQCHL